MNARNASEALVTPVLGFGGFCGLLVGFVLLLLTGIRLQWP
jgi:hypothetical protein